MTKCVACGGELKRHKRVTRVVGKQMVKGHIYKCADCGRLALNSEVWQRVDFAEHPPEVKIGL